jgi:hypothetical protein
MAIDTRQKRFSIISLSSPWRVLAVPPSGSVIGADRQQFLYGYAGISWASVAGLLEALWAPNAVFRLSASDAIFRPLAPQATFRDDASEGTPL